MAPGGGKSNNLPASHTQNPDSFGVDPVPFIDNDPGRLDLPNVEGSLQQLPPPPLVGPVFSVGGGPLSET